MSETTNRQNTGADDMSLIAVDLQRQSGRIEDDWLEASSASEALELWERDWRDGRDGRVVKVVDLSADVVLWSLPIGAK